MKQILSIFVSLWLAAPLFAQTNSPVKLALIAQSSDAATAVDLLTAQLSGNSTFQLLDRDEIDKVFHEQGLSAANRNDLELGRILGADGLLILNVIRSPNATNLTMRLIAVKPGVILTDGSVSWPLKDSLAWAGSAAEYLQKFLPKLSLSARDAIPISVVNLSSAVQSADALETERDLKLLTIQRLSEEPQFFVLERQKMQLLSNEKNFNADDTAFWDGSYLLDGTIDQNGYSKDTITVNARLRPPRGGAPLLFEVQGSRTNLAEVVNALAIKVASMLKVNSSIQQWDAAGEALQYFDEATWALKWGVYSEAEAAADSAWALGKHDLPCATVRVRAYVSDALACYVPFQQGVSYLGDGPGAWNEVLQYISDLSKSHVAVPFDKRLAEIDYSTLSDNPNPAGIQPAINALEVYYEFCRSSTNRLMSNSDWYNLGIQDLVAASKILQDFNFAIRAQDNAKEPLADLRQMARSVAGLIAQTPAVENSFFGSNAALPDNEYVGTWYEKPNIFLCELNWGCFWQESPGDEIALYEWLMRSRIFGQIHDDFWFRPAERPLLVAWTDAERRTLASAQNQFLRDLDNSSNSVMRLEGRAIQLRDAISRGEAAEAITNLYETLIACTPSLITNHVAWDVGDLTAGIDGNKDEAGNIEFEETPDRPVLLKICSTFSDKLHAEQEKGTKILEEQKKSEVFEKQKQYLANLTPYNFLTFVNVFQLQNYTKAQACEILSLVGNYESNMIARAAAQNKYIAKGNAQFIDTFLGNRLNQIVNRPAAQAAGSMTFSRRTGLRTAPAAAPVATAPPVFGKNSAPTEEIPTNILNVIRFIKIPEQMDSNDLTGERIFSRRWSNGKLLFGLEHERQIYDFDTNGNWIDTHEVTISKFAIFDPANETWIFVKGSELPADGAVLGLRDNNNRIIFFHGQLFSSIDGPVKKFDFQKQGWQTLDIPVPEGSDLFSIDDRLYAANESSFLDITEPGNVRILAATRRRPVVTALDSLDTFAVRPNFPRPQLFAGPDQSLCASIGTNIYRWNGKDWHEILKMNISQPPEIFEDAVLFRHVAGYGSDDRSSLWLWSKSQAEPELCLSDKPKPHPGIIRWYDRPRPPQPVHARWESLPDDYLTSSVTTIYNSCLYFLVEHADVKRNSSGRWSAVEKNGYHAKLVCLSPDLAMPIVIPLKFDTTRAQPPLRILGEETLPQLMFDRSALNTSLHFSGDFLYLDQQNIVGVWAIPVSQLQSALATAKRSLIAKNAQGKADHEKQMAEERASTESIRRQFLARYDRNHNGIIDPDEKEEALDDPAYIEWELDKIDANHDGWLEASELSWFDANKNKILDAKEEAGIDIAQHLLAIRLMKKFDADGKGYLTQFQFNQLKQSCTGIKERGFYVPPFPGQNFGPKIDLQSVEDFLKRQTAKALALPGSGVAVANQLSGANGPVDRTRIFKLEVEYYWDHSGGDAN